MKGTNRVSPRNAVSPLYQSPMWHTGWLPALFDQKWLKDVLLGRVVFEGEGEDAYDHAQLLYIKAMEAVSDAIYLTEDIVIKPDYAPVPCTWGSLWTVRLFLYIRDRCVGAVDDMTLENDVLTVYSGYVALAIGRPKMEAYDEDGSTDDDGSGQILEGLSETEEHMERDQEKDDESPLQRLSALRRSRNTDVQGVGRLRGILRVGDVPWIQGWSDYRQGEQQPGIQARELPLGVPQGAGEQQDLGEDVHHRRTYQVPRTVVQDVRHPSICSMSQNERLWMEHRRRPHHACGREEEKDTERGTKNARKHETGLGSGDNPLSALQFSIYPKWYKTDSLGCGGAFPPLLRKPERNGNTCNEGSFLPSV